jgi:hypothetical protein
MSSRDQQGSAGPDNKKRSKTEEPTKNPYPDARIIANEAFEMRYGTADGKQFYQFFGPGGTMHTIYADGTHDIKTIGEKKEYNKAGVTITVDENGDVHIRGHNKLQVGGGAHIEVAGDAGVVVGGSVAMSMPTGDFGVQAKNIYIGARGNFNLNVEGDTTVKTTGTTQFDSGKNHNTNAKNIASVAEEGTLINTSGGDTNVKASGDVVTKGATTKVQEGGAGAPPTTFT